MQKSGKVVYANAVRRPCISTDAVPHTTAQWIFRRYTATTHLPGTMQTAIAAVLSAHILAADQQLCLLFKLCLEARGKISRHLDRQSPPKLSRPVPGPRPTARDTARVHAMGLRSSTSPCTAIRLRSIQPRRVVEPAFPVWFKLTQTGKKLTTEVWRIHWKSSWQHCIIRYSRNNENLYSP